MCSVFLGGVFNVAVAVIGHLIHERKHARTLAHKRALIHFVTTADEQQQQKGKGERET